MTKRRVGISEQELVKEGGALNSYIPLVSSGLDSLSLLLPNSSIEEQYLDGTWLVNWQKLQVTFFPPSEQENQGFTYPLHLPHLRGPSVPASTSGSGSSPSSWSARGWSIAPKGKRVVLMKLLSDGRVDIVGLRNLGEAFPGKRI